ncbi:MAG TPA: hypothetical protein VFZ09_49845 [Archangium sp.]|uniref:hypothetical protein n=1 Tax=Archangium sp. TaxID=1872627 RepID=UPI002E37E2F8|nr:hypothetical protein [Archangium sp.]HEX5754386.1 hypothetical protein [Archangium sp.]
MSTARSTHRWSGSVLLVVLLFCQVARASAPGPQDESIRARLKACLLMGEMKCVVEQYLLLRDLGRMPGWLVAFQNAFAVANRRAGECEKVARAIHEGLRELAQKPVFIRFTVEGSRKNLGFDVLKDGVLVKNLQISSTGHHVAVQLDDRVIDAYTGLAGLPLREYIARLSTDSGSRIVHEIVETL